MASAAILQRDLHRSNRHLPTLSGVSAPGTDWVIE
jgi:hypothetical protein